MSIEVSIRCNREMMRLDVIYMQYCANIDAKFKNKNELLYVLLQDQT